MKKSFLIIGLFSLMMVLTSFNTPNETGGRQQVGTSTEPTQYSSETGGRQQVGTSTEPTQYTSETGGRQQVGTSTEPTQ